MARRDCPHTRANVVTMPNGDRFTTCEKCHRRVRWLNVVRRWIEI
jgi:hypothetical protein